MTKNKAVITAAGVLAEFRKIAASGELADLFKNRDTKKDTLQHLEKGRDRYTQKAEAKEAEAAQAEADVDAAIQRGDDAVKLSAKAKKLREEADDLYKLAEQAADQIPVAAKDCKEADRLLFDKLNALIGQLCEERQASVQKQFEALMVEIGGQIEAWNHAQDQFQEECGLEMPFDQTIKIRANHEDSMYLRDWLL